MEGENDQNGENGLNGIQGLNGQIGEYYHEFPVVEENVNPLFNAHVSTARRIINRYGHLIRWRGNMERILHLGCASGRITCCVLFPFLQPYAAEVMGMDIKEDVIVTANLVYGNSVLKFRCSEFMDEIETGDLNNYFDHIISLFELQYLPDQGQWLDAVHRLLKPGGQMFVTLVSFTPLHLCLDLQSNDARWGDYVRSSAYNYTTHPTAYIKTLVANHGFVVDEIRKVSRYALPLSEFDLLKEIFVEVNPTYKRLPDELVEEYTVEFLALMEEICRHETLHRYEYMFVLATKH